MPDINIDALEVTREDGETAAAIRAALYRAVPNIPGYPTDIIEPYLARHRLNSIASYRAQLAAGGGEATLDMDRSPAQFFFEVGYGAAYAEALIRNDMKPPFDFSDALVEHAWEIAGEAHEDPAEFDRYLATANSISSTPTTDAAKDDEIERLKAGLRPFADRADRYDNNPAVLIHDNVELWQLEANTGMRVDITVGDLRKARALLSNGGGNAE